jgi:hypothetical protein
MKPAASQPETASVSPPNDATGAPGTTPATPSGSAASATGTVTAEQALSGLDHTKIPGIGAPGASGQPGVGSFPGASPSATVSLGGMIQGEWAVNIMDALLPAAVVAGFYSFGLKLRKSEIQMTEKEKATVIPIMQKCLDSILLNFNNPWSALAITLGAIYGGKLVEKGFVAYVDKKQEKQQDEALKERIAAADRASDPAKYDPANQSANDIQSGAINVIAGKPYTEDDVNERRKKAKCNRENAIKYLDKKYGIK